jgi:hypothetical protein
MKVDGRIGRGTMVGASLALSRKSDATTPGLVLCLGDKPRTHMKCVQIASTLPGRHACLSPMAPPGVRVDTPLGKPLRQTGSVTSRAPADVTESGVRTLATIQRLAALVLVHNASDLPATMQARVVASCGIRSQNTGVASS